MDWYDAANNGGPSGRELYDRVVMSAHRFLLPFGSVWLVHPWFFSLHDTAHLASISGLRLQVVAWRRFPMGTLSGRMLPYIESLGFVPDYGPRGQPVQKMSVIRLTS